MLGWALTEGSDTRSAHDTRLGVRLAAYLGSFCFGIGAFAEGRAWLLRALDVDTGDRTPERAALLCSASEFLGPADDQRRPALEEALAVSRSLGDPGLETEALTSLAREATDAHEFDRADQLARESRRRPQPSATGTASGVRCRREASSSFNAVSTPRPSTS